MRWVWEFGDPKEDYIIDDSCQVNFRFLNVSLIVNFQKWSLFMTRRCNWQIKFRVESISYPSVPIERSEDAKPFAPMVVTVSSLIKLFL